MNLSYIFFNPAGRLRSGWRLCVFLVIYYVLLLVAWTSLQLVSSALPAYVRESLKGTAGWVAQAFIFLSVAVLAGWMTGRLLESLSLRALGWALHQGWARDFLMGSALGAASLLVAAALATFGGGFRFSFAASGMFAATGKTLLISGLVFIIAAASEEALFRGYPLQTLTRAHLAWLGVIITSALFAYIHLDNPHVVPGFTFINTALAGVWLAVAYLRTRSLWFPLGVHWAWNWTMGAILGLPVSGIERLTPAPILRATDIGPAWLTGGAYGIEGGAACTLALILSTVYIWRTRLVSATDEMKEMTDYEIRDAETQGRGDAGT